MYTEQLTQELGIYTEIDPQILNNSNATAGGVDMTKFKRAFFIVQVGAITSGGKLNIVMQESANSNMSSPTSLAGNSVSATNYNTANSILTFEVRADLTTKQWQGIKVTEVGSQNTYVSVMAIGMDAIHKPGNAANVSAVNTQYVAAP
jgi:hypothetical protein